ncbi:MAG: GntR family transcriptional regulator [Pseudorhodoplanes sp.]|uniref:GntR family transcriptional regulator n=1 Tax=Pseudorhodoplanes sp. TaxID=1934341 RepID=UPI003D111E24
MSIEAPDLSGLHAVESGTLGQRVYSELRDFLMVGGVKPGEKITLRQLTSAFGTSLMPVREAVQRLAAEGALEVLPNRAIRVPIATKAGVREILKVRLMLEGLAVEEAAARIQPEAIAQLEELNAAFTQEMRTREDSAQLFRVNKEFHFTIYRAAHMPVLLGIIENLWLRIGPFLHFSLGVRGREATRKFAPDSHKEIIRAMRESDGALGRAALESDLAGAAELILQLGNLPD